MNDVLQNTLAELAQQLGTTTGQLWDWMHGEGIQAYARVEIVQDAMRLMCSLLIVAMGVAFIRWAWNGAKSAYDDSGYVVGCIIVGIFVAFLLFSAVSVAADLAGWLASPEGMVIKMLVETCNGRTL